MKNNKVLIIIFLIIVISSSFLVFTIFNHKYYTISFNTSGGNSINPLEVKANTKVNSLPKPKKEGYTFLYWTLDNEVFNLDKPITKNIILEAQYQELEPSLVIIRFDTLGGTLINDLKVPKGSIITLPKAQKEGYKFICWLYLNKEYDESLPLNNNLTLIAKYQKEG